jgi:hypothetical protein
MLDLGIRLSLLVGPTVPLPATPDVLDALVSLEVKNQDKGRDAFQITFGLGPRGPLDYSLLTLGRFDPMTRVVISVLVGTSLSVLIDGVVTNHQVVPGNRPGESTLTVTGEDISLRMDLEETQATYPAQPDSVVVGRVLLSYVQFGIVPQVTPTPTVTLPTDRMTTQQETDLAFLKRLAQRNGFVFYLDPIAPGVLRAYWGPENRLGLPQSALVVGQGAATNLDTPPTITFDPMQVTAPQLRVTIPGTSIAVAIPIPTGVTPPLARSPAAPLRKPLDRDSARLDSALGVLQARADAVDTSDAVFVSGQVDTARYGQVLKARGLVGLRGVGDTYGGLYFVREVTHRIERGKYQQSFTLVREGTGTTLPVVPP